MKRKIAAILAADIVGYSRLASEAEIGFDGETPSKELPLPVCDRRDPVSVPASAQTYLRAPSHVKSASVRLTYGDGGHSLVAAYQRP